jgi:predicted secreted protein
MTDASIGYGTQYRIWDTGTSPADYFQIGEVINVTPGEATADRIDATHMLSPNRRREYIAGLIDNGEASFEINWVPGNDTDVFLRELFESGETRDHQVEFPNGAIVTFEASIIGYSKAVPIDDRMTATVTVAVSGAETWTQASS